MSDTRSSFIDLAVAGTVALDDIDDFVAAWHAKPGSKSLHDFLGLSEAEYSLWLRDPDTLPYIVKARNERLPLQKVVNDSYQQFQLVPRPECRVKAKRLKQWLDEQAKAH